MLPRRMSEAEIERDEWMLACDDNHASIASMPVEGHA
jgi:hypothetical protein